jgi:phage terminase large subunit
VWGTDWLPHDGNAADLKTGKSAKEILRKLGRRAHIIPRMEIEAGIKAARMMFGRCYIDEDKGARLVDCLRRYKRAVPETTGEPGRPVHDEYSHGADAFRGLGVIVDKLDNDDRKPLPYVAPYVQAVRGVM